MRLLSLLALGLSGALLSCGHNSPPSSQPPPPTAAAAPPAAAVDESSKPAANKGWEIVINEIVFRKIPNSPQMFMVKGKVSAGEQCPDPESKGVDVIAYTSDIEGGNIQLQKNGDLPRSESLAFQGTGKEEFSLPIWLGHPQGSRGSYKVYGILVCASDQEVMRSIAAQTHDRYTRATDIWRVISQVGKPLAMTPAFRVEREK
jgi:hypothetical protein